MIWYLGKSGVKYLNLSKWLAFHEKTHFCKVNDRVLFAFLPNHDLVSEIWGEKLILSKNEYAFFHEKLKVFLEFSKFQPCLSPNP